MTDRLKELIERLRYQDEVGIFAASMTDGHVVVSYGEAADALTALRTQRKEVVEECAAVADDMILYSAEDIATAIRNLKSQDEPR